MQKKKLVMIKDKRKVVEKYPAPEHLDYQTRNNRLYKTLLSLGLYVEPVFVDDARTDIAYMRVSVGKPS